MTEELTIQQAAKLKGVHDKTVAYWLNVDKLPYHTKDGDKRGTRYIWKSDLDNFQNRRRNTQIQKMRQRLLGVDLSGLNPQQRRVLVLRYGLEDGRGKSLRKVGDLMDLSYERVRKIEEQALKSLDIDTDAFSI